jgi:hypothetical protein
MSLENFQPIQLSPVGRSIEDFFATVDACYPELLRDDGVAPELLDRGEFAISIREEGIDVDFEDWNGLTDLEFLNIAKNIVRKRRTHEV